MKLRHSPCPCQRSCRDESSSPTELLFLFVRDSADLSLDRHGMFNRQASVVPDRLQCREGAGPPVSPGLAQRDPAVRAMDGDVGERRTRGSLCSTSSRPWDRLAPGRTSALWCALTFRPALRVCRVGRRRARRRACSSPSVAVEETSAVGAAREGLLSSAGREQRSPEQLRHAAPSAHVARGDWSIAPSVPWSARCRSGTE